MLRHDYISALKSDVKAGDFRSNIACNWVNEITQDQKDIPILDIGCGLGQLILRLEELGYSNLFGVDGSESAVQYIKTRVQHARVLHMDIEKDGLPFPNEHFNIVICMEVFEHLYDPVSAVNEIARVIRPGGYGIFSFPNEYRLTQRINFLMGRSISSPLRTGGHIKFFNRDLVVKFVGEYLRIHRVYAVGNERVRQLPALTKILPTLFAKWFFVLAQKPAHDPGLRFPG
jgi:2-polyprenyl-3-methyl-5-hydroxy-6-metoxy-1,4-benzoquinol methylase